MPIGDMARGIGQAATRLGETGKVIGGTGGLDEWSKLSEEERKRRLAERGLMAEAAAQPAVIPQVQMHNPVKATLDTLHTTTPDKENLTHVANDLKKVAKMYSQMTGGRALQPDIHLALVMSGLPMVEIEALLRSNPEAVAQIVKQQQEGKPVTPNMAKGADILSEHAGLIGELNAGKNRMAGPIKTESQFNFNGRIAPETAEAMGIKQGAPGEAVGENASASNPQGFDKHTPRSYTEYERHKDVPGYSGQRYAPWEQSYIDAAERPRTARTKLSDLVNTLFDENYQLSLKDTIKGGPAVMNADGSVYQPARAPNPGRALNDLLEQFLGLLKDPSQSAPKIERVESGSNQLSIPGVGVTLDSRATFNGVVDIESMGDYRGFVSNPFGTNAVPWDMFISWGRGTGDRGKDIFQPYSGFSERGRFGSFGGTGEASQFPDSKIKDQDERLTNIHVIPGSPEVAKAMEGVAPGDKVSISAVAVDVYLPNGLILRTDDTTSNDRCEIVVVKEIRVVEKGAFAPVKPTPENFRAGQGPENAGYPQSSQVAPENKEAAIAALKAASEGLAATGNISPTKQGVVPESPQNSELASLSGVNAMAAQSGTPGTTLMGKEEIAANDQRRADEAQTNIQAAQDKVDEQHKVQPTWTAPPQSPDDYDIQFAQHPEDIKPVLSITEFNALSQAGALNLTTSIDERLDSIFGGSPAPFGSSSAKGYYDSLGKAVGSALDPAQGELVNGQMLSYRDTVAMLEQTHPELLPTGVTVAAIDEEIASIKREQQRVLQQVQGPLGEDTDPNKVFAGAAIKTALHAPGNTLIAEMQMEETIVNYQVRTQLSAWLINPEEARYSGLTPVGSNSQVGVEPDKRQGNMAEQRRRAQDNPDMVAIDPDNPDPKFAGLVGFRLPKTQGEIRAAGEFWADSYSIPTGIDDYLSHLHTLKPWEMGLLQKDMAKRGYPVAITEQPDIYTQLTFAVYYMDSALLYAHDKPDEELDAAMRGESTDPQLQRAVDYLRDFGRWGIESKATDPALWEIFFTPAMSPENEAGLTNEEKQARKLARIGILSHLQVGALTEFGKTEPEGDIVLDLFRDMEAGDLRAAFPANFSRGDQGAVADTIAYDIYMRQAPTGQLPEVTIGRFAAEFGEERLPHDVKDALYVSRGDVWKERISSVFSTVGGGIGDVAGGVNDSGEFIGKMATDLLGDASIPAVQQAQLYTDVIWNRMYKPAISAAKPVGSYALKGVIGASDYVGREALFVALVAKTGFSAMVNATPTVLTSPLSQYLADDEDTFDTLTDNFMRWYNAAHPEQIWGIPEWENQGDQGVVDRLKLVAKYAGSFQPLTENQEKDVAGLFIELGVDPNEHPVWAWMLDFGLETVGTMGLGAAVRTSKPMVAFKRALSAEALDTLPFLSGPLKLADETADPEVLRMLTNDAIGEHPKLMRAIAEGNNTRKIIDDYVDSEDAARLGTEFNKGYFYRMFEPSPAMVKRQVVDKLNEFGAIDKISAWMKPFFVVPAKAVNFADEPNLYAVARTQMQAARFTKAEQAEWMKKLDDIEMIDDMASELLDDAGRVISKRNLREAWLDELEEARIYKVWEGKLKTSGMDYEAFKTMIRGEADLLPGYKQMVKEYMTKLKQTGNKSAYLPEVDDAKRATGRDASALDTGKMRESLEEITETRLLKGYAEKAAPWSDDVSDAITGDLGKLHQDFKNLDEWTSQFERATAKDFTDEAAYRAALDSDETYQSVKALKEAKETAFRNSDAYRNADDARAVFEGLIPDKKLMRISEALSVMRKSGEDFISLFEGKPTAVSPWQLSQVWRPKVDPAMLHSLQHGKFAAPAAREYIQRWLLMDQQQMIWKRIVLAGFGTQLKISFDDMSRLVMSGINPFSAMWESWSGKKKLGEYANDVHNMLYNMVDPSQNYAAIGEGTGLMLTKKNTEWYLSHIAKDPIADTWMIAEKEAIAAGLDDAARSEFVLERIKQPLMKAFESSKAYEYKAYPGADTQNGLVELLVQRGVKDEDEVMELARRQEAAYRHAAKLGDKNVMDVWDKFKNAAEGKPYKLSSKEWDGLSRLNPTIIGDANASIKEMNKTGMSSIASAARTAMSGIGKGLYYPLTKISENAKGSVYLHFKREKLDELIGGLEEISDATRANAEYLAHGHALKMIDEITYNTARTPLEHALRNVIPFGPAYRDFYVYWSKHFLQRPEQIPMLLKMQDMPDEAKVSAKSIRAIPGLGKLAGLIMDWGGIAPESVWRVSPKSAFFFTGGVGSFLPGFSIFMTTPLARLIESDPDAYGWITDVPGFSFANPDSPMFAKWDKLAFGLGLGHLPKVGPFQLGTKDNTTERQVNSEYQMLVGNLIDEKIAKGELEGWPYEADYGIDPATAGPGSDPTKRNLKMTNSGELQNTDDHLLSDAERDELMEQAKTNVKRQSLVGFVGSYLSPAGNRLETTSAQLSRAKSLLYSAETFEDRMIAARYLAGEKVELPAYMQEEDGRTVTPVAPNLRETVQGMAVAIGSSPNQRSRMVMDNPRLLPMLLSTSQRDPKDPKGYTNMTPDALLKQDKERAQEQKEYEQKYLNTIAQQFIEDKWAKRANENAPVMRNGEAALTHEENVLKNLETGFTTTNRGGVNTGKPSSADERAYAEYLVTTTGGDVPSRMRDVFPAVVEREETKRLDTIAEIKGMSDIATATEAQLATVGLPTDPATLAALDAYVKADNTIYMEMKAAGISGFTSKGGEDFANRLDAKVNELSETTPGFAQIYRLSQVPEWMRAKELGYGAMDAATKSEWDKAYALLDTMTKNMANAANTKEKDAIQKAAMEEIAKLKAENEKFAKEFSALFNGKNDLKPTAKQLRAYEGDYSTRATKNKAKGKSSKAKGVRRGKRGRAGSAKKGGGIKAVKAYKGKSKLRARRV